MTLGEYLDLHKINPKDFGKLVDKSEGAVRKWRYGERMPRLPEIVKIERITNGAVTANDFAQPEAHAS